MKRIFVIALLLSFCMPAFNQNIEMVKDINPNGESYVYDLSKCTYSSGMQYVTKMFFRADDGTTGLEPWVSDGTEAGTYLLKDLNPTGSSFASEFHSVGFGLSQKVIFFAQTSNYGNELWVTNGTEAGTTLLKDIYAGSNSSIPYFLNQYYFLVYFSANDSVHGKELWKTDGTVQNTVIVKDINTGTNSSNPSVLIPFNSKLYFVAKTEASGYELWCTDGTETGTTMVKDINPGTGNAFFYGSNANFQGIVFENKLYFTADDGVYGHELWVTDGTALGTMMIKDINTSGDSYPQNYFIVNNELFFIARDQAYYRQIWKTDGTTAGTVRITSCFMPLCSFSNMYQWNDQVYFYASDTIHDYELWTSDGTTTGTRMIKDINPAGSSKPYVSSWNDYNGYLYFIAKINNGDELFRTDGTEAGTELIAPPIAPYSEPLYVSLSFINYNNAMYFRAGFTSHSYELWKLTDSTTTISPVAMENKMVYPNPAGNSIYINCKGEATIYNAMGKSVKTVSVEPDAPIDISDLTEGLYFIVSHQNPTVSKFVKQN
jgi:ELWxxDGT repeat protein